MNLEESDRLGAFLQAVRNRDGRRIGEILHGYQDEIVPMLAARLRLNGSQSADDIFSSSLTRLLESLASGKAVTLPQRSLRAWLFSIALRRGIDAVRAHRSRQEEPFPQEESLAEGTPCGMERAGQTETLERIRALIASKRVGLSEKQRSILQSDLARHFDLGDGAPCLSDEELAMTLGVCRQRIWNLRSQARARLAPYLMESLSDE